MAREIHQEWNNPIDLLPSHLHGDEEILMHVVESTNGTAAGTTWFRFLLECDRHDCKERVIAVIRASSDMKSFDGEPVVDITPRDKDDLPRRPPSLAD